MPATPTRGPVRPWQAIATYVEARQAEANEAVASGLRSGPARSLVRRADGCVATFGAAALAFVVLLGTGSLTGPVAAGVAAVAVLALIVGAVTVTRLARVEGADGNGPHDGDAAPR